MDTVIIKACLNGGRSRSEHPAVPLTPEEVAEEARRCAEAGAATVHVHARTSDGGWSYDPAWYEAAHRRIRQHTDLLVSDTTVREASIPVQAVLAALTDCGPPPELASVNLGHITAWVADPAAGRRTVHYPNSYDDIRRILTACAERGVLPELAVMDTGFVSNAVALAREGVIAEPRWFLVELDGGRYGDGVQAMPSTVENFLFLSARLREQFPGALWAAHGYGLDTYPVVAAALAQGQHVRVGFEDCVALPDGRPAHSNAELVEWAVRLARLLGREPATPAEARRILSLG